ncbi:ABC transporter permease [Pediococcus stilesii]|uniref:Putative hemin transport system permease protein HrtB n=1 Tax=Pediococcus stilesii TaxID=331679 RepID=A0A5R9BUL0_9LACO|nr:ABC transporter permease [Pediococcus stilesii]TLQ04408.1 ABC transporter permease [Pediococcus stilesii]
MFLALKEIKREKLRYSLIIGMIVLISYLIFILTSLALGLARQNTDAINSWNVNTVVLNQDANVNLSQSLITDKQVKDQGLTGKDALIGQISVVAKEGQHDKISSTFLGLDNNQFIAKNLKLTSGHKMKKSHEVVVDDKFEQSGYKLNDKIKLNDDDVAYKIVGFTHNAKLNIAPVIYGSLSDWRTLKHALPQTEASAIVSKTKKLDVSTPLKAYTTNAFIEKLPGYSAQNMTFSLMIGFLMVISLIVIAIFLYILTIQKLPNYAVLRAQGIPSRVLVWSTIAQSLILVLGGVIIGAILTTITAFTMPAAVPMAFDIPALAAVGAGLMVTALLGGLLPIRSVIKVDPVSVIGG